MEQSVKATVRDTLQRLSSASTNVGGNIAGTGIPTPPVFNSQFTGPTPAPSFNTAQSQGRLFRSTDPIVSAASTLSPERKSVKGLPVFSADSIKAGPGSNVSTAVLAPQNSSSMTLNISIINDGQGIVVPSLPPVVPPAPSLASESPITLTTSATPANTEPTATTTTALPSTLTTAATQTVTTEPATSVSDTTSTLPSTTATATSILTTSLAPVIVVSSVGLKATASTMKPILDISSSSQSAISITVPPSSMILAPIAGSAKSEVAKSSNLSAARNDIQIMKRKPTTIEVPAPPPALINPWLSRFPRHLEVPIQYKMPRDKNLQIEHNVLNQAVVVKKLPSTHKNIHIVQASIPKANANIPSGHANNPSGIVNVPSAQSNIQGIHSNIPIANVDIPSSHANIQIAHANIPSANVDIPSAHANIPITHANMPSANANFLNAHSNTPSAHLDVPRTNANMHSANANIPSVNANMLSANANIPNVHANILSAHANIPNVHVKIPNADTNAASAQAIFPSAHAKIPHSNIPDAHLDIHITHGDTSPGFPDAVPVFERQRPAFAFAPKNHMIPPLAPMNLKAHAQSFGLVGHGGDIGKAHFTTLSPSANQLSSSVLTPPHTTRLTSQFSEL